MSTVKVSALQNASSATPNLVLAADGSVSGGLPYPNRNLLHNGAMQVHQRGTSAASISVAGYFTADRWIHILGTLGTWTQSVENDAPTGSGFRKSQKILCTTADASPAAGDYHFWAQKMEGQDLQRIAKGTASAQQLTLSFWVKSNVTGTYVAELRDVDNTRTANAQYTISASATWERKVITFPADTTGALNNDNTDSLWLNFWLGAGATFTSGTLHTAWAAEVNGDRAPGQTNLAAATNNYWQITGVQLEVGPVATPFEFKSFGQELQECQRYYCRIVPGIADGMYGVGFAYATTAALINVPFPSVMRASPAAVEQNGTAADYRIYNTAANPVACSSVVTFGKATPMNAYCTASVASGVVAGNATMLGAVTTTAYLGFSADL